MYGYIDRINKPLKVKIKGYSKHGIHQAISRDGRGVKPSAQSATIRAPRKTIVQKRGGSRTIRMERKRSIVVVNMKRKVVTTMARGKGNTRIKRVK